MPVSSRQLPIMPTVIQAYGDVWRAARAMRLLFCVGILIVLATGLAQDLIPAGLWKGVVSGNLLGFAADVIKGFCLTPILIAIHRFIILGDVTGGYAPDPGEPGFMRFFGWLVVLSVVDALVFLLPDILTSLDTPAFTASVVFFGVLMLAAMRLSILFPAIAIQAPGAYLRQALVDSRGRLGRIVLIFMLTLLPGCVLLILLSLLLGRGVAHAGSTPAIANLAVGAVISTAMLWLCAALASRMFQALGQTLLRPAQAQIRPSHSAG